MIETVTELFINGFVHPIFALLVAAIFKVTVLFHKIDIFVDHIPYFLYPEVVKAGIGQYLRRPAALRSREKMQRITELSGGQLGTFQIISIRLVDDDTVRHLHNAALDALQLIARTGKLDKQEEVHH